MPIYPNIYQTLLPGPIVELRGYLAACGLRGRLYAYLNYNGPTGTARDELAEGMLALALSDGAVVECLLLGNADGFTVDLEGLKFSVGRAGGHHGSHAENQKFLFHFFLPLLPQVFGASRHRTPLSGC